MEFTLNKIPLGTLCAQPDTVSEQPVDIDFTLPDYCPDIEKILKCKITPKIYNRALSGGQLTVDGATVVTILYTDASGGLRVCEQTVPYSVAFPVKDTPECYALDTYTKPEYVNCRALSQRRLTVHGAFSLYARVLQSCPVELCSPCEESALEYNTSEIPASSLSAFCSEQFTAGDGIKVTNKPSVAVVLDSSVRADVTGFKLIPDKLMLNGELAVHMLYLSAPESGSVETLDYTIPFTEVIDCRGLTEESEVCPVLSVLSYEIRLKNDIMSESPIVDVEARLNALVTAYSRKNVTVILDAYSTELAVVPELSQIKVPFNTTVLSDTFIHKDTLDDLELGEIIDIRADVVPLTPSLGEKSITLGARMSVQILGRNTDGELVYLERSKEISREIITEQDFENVESCSVSVVSLSYRMGENNTVEIRLELRYCVTVCETRQLSAVTAVTADESAKLTRKPCALILYYADEGELIWDIAKFYNISVSSVARENELAEDVLSAPRMLLIPTA